MTKETAKPPEKKKEKESIWTKEERENFRTEYGCDIVVEDGSFAEVSIKQAPTDAYIIKYFYKDKIHFDLTRGTKVTVFDMYWDKFKNDLKSIDYGNGGVKPNLWGYQSPAPKKKRKS
jgi:hypothetical protein